MLPSLPPTGSRVIIDFEIQPIHQIINGKKKKCFPSLPPTGSRVVTDTGMLFMETHKQWQMQRIYEYAK